MNIQRRGHFCIAVGLVSSLLCLMPLSTAQAQIVNVLDKAKPGQENGLKGSVSASATFKSGNTNVRQLKLGGGLAYKADDHLIYLITRVAYGDKPTAAVGSTPALNNPFISETFEHLRYRFELKDWLMAEAYLQHELSLFRDLSLRAVTGAGPRFSTSPAEGLDIAFATSLMVELERYENNSDDSDSGIIQLRASNYIQGVYAFNKQTKASATVFFQPRFDDPDDYRVHAEAALTVKASKNFSVKLGFRWDFDSKPPGSRNVGADASAVVEKDDMSFDTSLGWSF